MAKHPHRIMLLDKKTWRCMLPGCRYFIHLGLQHTLPGQTSICWGCSEQFMLDEEAITEEMPHCHACRMKRSGFDFDAMADYTEAKMALSKAGVKSVSELDPTQRRTLEAVKGIKFDALKEPEEDQIEVYDEWEQHTPSCDIRFGGVCSCT